MEQLSALVALSETWKWIETSAPSEGLATTVAAVAAGLSALVGWMTLTGSILAMYKSKWRNRSIWKVI